jgi:hypothetical protein
MLCSLLVQKMWQKEHAMIMNQFNFYVKESTQIQVPHCTSTIFSTILWHFSLWDDRSMNVLSVPAKTAEETLYSACRGPLRPERVGTGQPWAERPRIVWQYSAGNRVNTRADESPLPGWLPGNEYSQRTTLVLHYSTVCRSAELLQLSVGTSVQWMKF